MSKFKVTLQILRDVILEASTPEEAMEKAKEEGVEFTNERKVAQYPANLTKRKEDQKNRETKRKEEKTKKKEEEKEKAKNG